MEEKTKSSCPANRDCHVAEYNRLLAMTEKGNRDNQSVIASGPACNAGERGNLAAILR